MENILTQTTGWNYSTLTKTASYYGGPEKFINTIYQTGLIDGFKKATVLDIKLGLFIAAASATITYVVVKNVHSKKDKLETKKSIEDIYTVLEKSFS